MRVFFSRPNNLTASSMRNTPMPSALAVYSGVSKLTFTVGRDITDASAAFANLQSGAIGGIVTAPAVQLLTNYTATYGSVAWDYARNRTRFGVSGTWEKDSYDGQPLLDV